MAILLLAAAAFATKVCPTCGEHWPDENNFCVYDGTPLVWICPNCGATFTSADERVCAKCGYNVDVGSVGGGGKVLYENDFATDDLKGLTVSGNVKIEEGILTLRGGIFHSAEVAFGDAGLSNYTFSGSFRVRRINKSRGYDAIKVFGYRDGKKEVGFFVSGLGYIRFCGYADGYTGWYPSKLSGMAEGEFGDASDGRWHSFTLRFNGRYVYPQIDGRPEGLACPLEKQVVWKGDDSKIVSFTSGQLGLEAAPGHPGTIVEVDDLKVTQP